MNIVEVKLKISKKQDKDKQLHSMHQLLGSYRMNGQVLGQELTIFQQGLEYVSHLKLPHAESLQNKYNNVYVDQSIEKLSDAGLEQPIFTVLGEEIDASQLCKCRKASGYILYTSYILIESPLRCLDCFGTIPLYQIPKTDKEDYYDIICWQSDYQSCDRLQMNCSVGERFAINQMSKLDSALTQQGLEICRKVTKATKKFIYYYLYRGKSKSIKFEKERVCPSCREKWHLAENLHGIFDFKCKKCLLLSNISWDIRSSLATEQVQ